MKKQRWILLTVLVLLCAALALGLRPRMPQGTIYAWQGDVAFFEQEGRLGLVNRQGKVLLEPSLTGGGLFDEHGVAPVKYLGGCALLRRDGSLIQPQTGFHEYQLASAPLGLYSALGYDENWTPLTLLVSPQHGTLTDRGYVCPPDGRLYLQGDEGWYAAAPDGTPLGEPFAADTLWMTESGLLSVNLGDRSYLNTLEGETLFIVSNPRGQLLSYRSEADGSMAQLPWPDAWPMGTEHMLFRHNGLTGAAHRARGVVLEPCWDSVTVLSTGEYLVSRDGAYSLLREDGSLRTAFTPGYTVTLTQGYREELSLLVLQHPSDPFAWQLLDLDGHPYAVPDRPCMGYGAETPRLQGGMLRVSSEQGEGWMDLSGRVYLDPAWSLPGEFMGGLGTARVGDALVFVNRRGEEAFRVEGLLHAYTNQVREVDGRRYYNVICTHPEENRFLITWVSEAGELLYPPA